MTDTQNNSVIAGADESPEMPQDTREWYLYLIRSAGNTLYCGITLDVARRFQEHSAGAPKGARALRGKGPLQLVYQAPAGNYSQALKLEYRVKRWRRLWKEQLINGARSLPILT